MELPIGFWLSQLNIFLCGICAAKHSEAVRKTPFYRVNIFPYHQHCHECSAELVKGQTPTWCEFFDRQPQTKPLTQARP